MESMRLGLVKASVLGVLITMGLALAQPAHADHLYYRHGGHHHSSYGFVYGGPGFSIGYSDGWYGPRYYGGYYPSAYYYDDPYYYSAPYYSVYYSSYPRHYYYPRHTYYGYGGYDRYRYRYYGGHDRHYDHDRYYRHH